MSNPGVFLRHEALYQCETDLQTAAGRVATQMGQLLQDLVPLQQTFQGNAAEAFEEFKAQVLSSQEKMQELLQQASNVLSNMHEHHITADGRAMQVMRG
jgi:WXG100 family type VII secretion target